MARKFVVQTLPICSSEATVAPTAVASFVIGSDQAEKYKTCDERADADECEEYIDHRNSHKAETANKPAKAEDSKRFHRAILQLAHLVGLLENGIIRWRRRV